MQHAWGEFWLGIGLIVVGVALAFVFWGSWLDEQDEGLWPGPSIPSRWPVVSCGLLIGLIGTVLLVRAIISML